MDWLLYHWARPRMCVCVSVEFVLGEALVKLKTKHNKHFLCTYVSLLLSLEFMQNSIHARTLVEFIGKIDTFFVCVAFSLRCFAFKFHYTTPAKQTSRNCYKWRFLDFSIVLVGMIWILDIGRIEIKMEFPRAGFFCVFVEMYRFWEKLAFLAIAEWFDLLEFPWFSSVTIDIPHLSVISRM